MLRRNSVQSGLRPNWQSVRFWGCRAMCSPRQSHFPFRAEVVNTAARYDHAFRASLMSLMVRDVVAPQGSNEMMS